MWFHEKCMSDFHNDIHGTCKHDKRQQCCWDVCCAFYCAGCNDRIGRNFKKIAKPCISLHCGKHNFGTIDIRVLCGDCRDKLRWDKKAQATACKVCCDKVDCDFVYQDKDCGNVMGALQDQI